MAETPRGRRSRRRFDDDFKAQAVRLVLDEGKSVGAVARDLDLTETALRDCVKRARADRTKGRTGLTTVEREELARLRKENRELRTEREILKKPRPSSRNTSREVRLDRRGEGLLQGQRVVSGTRRRAERLLRVVSPAGIGTRQARPPAEGARPRVL
jgi:transposase